MRMGSWVTMSQWYIFGRSHFTETGWKKHAKQYVAGELENCDLSGKVIAVTGANSGIGRETAKFLASRRARVWMICRSESRGNEALAAMAAEIDRESHGGTKGGGDLKLLVGDVSLASGVRSIGERLRAAEPKLDALVCNAGALLNEKTMTQEGVEATLASHLAFGSRMLAKELLPLLKAAPAPRCVFTTSGGMYNSRFPGVDACANPTTYDGQQAYIYAKRGQVILAEELARCEPEVTWVSSHPGWTGTPAVDAAFGDDKKYLQPMRTTWQGAEGQCWLCYADTARIESGALYLDRMPQRKHLAGFFFTSGSATKNTREEAQQMIKDLDALANKCLLHTTNAPAAAAAAAPASDK